MVGISLVVNSELGQHAISGGYTHLKPQNAATYVAMAGPAAKDSSLQGGKTVLIVHL